MHSMATAVAGLSAFVFASGCAPDLGLPPVSTSLATEPMCRHPLQVSGSRPSCGVGDITISVAVGSDGTVRWAEAVTPADLATQGCVQAAYREVLFIPAARCDGVAVPSIETFVLIEPVAVTRDVAPASHDLAPPEN